MDVGSIDEMFAALGPVTIRRMFGGKGIYHRGLILAIELRGEVLLKADDVSAPEFEAAGATRWSYEGRRDKPVLMPYWSIPEDALDDPDLMASWVRLAYAAALRASPRPGRKREDGGPWSGFADTTAPTGGLSRPASSPQPRSRPSLGHKDCRKRAR